MGEMILEGNAMERHLVEARVPQGSAVSLILLILYNSALIQCVTEYVSANGLSIVDNLGWLATGSDVNQVVTTIERCTAKSMEWASSQGLQFDTAKTDAVLFTRRPGHKKCLLPKLTVKIKIRDRIIQFTNQVTCWLGIRIVAHLMFQEHHNRCMKKARAAEARLRTHTKTYGVVLDRVRAVQLACIQAAAQYGSELWWGVKEVDS
jgi:hypothetical protein